MAAIQTDVRELLTNGCAKGRQQDFNIKQLGERIDKIEQRPERALTLASIAVSILAGMAAFMAWVNQK
jgi:hypothetical protein